MLAAASGHHQQRRAAERAAGEWQECTGSEPFRRPPAVAADRHRVHALARRVLRHRVGEHDLCIEATPAHLRGLDLGPLARARQVAFEDHEVPRVRRRTNGHRSEAQLRAHRSGEFFACERRSEFDLRAHRAVVVRDLLDLGLHRLVEGDGEPRHHRRLVRQTFHRQPREIGGRERQHRRPQPTAVERGPQHCRTAVAAARDQRARAIDRQAARQVLDDLFETLLHRTVVGTEAVARVPAPAAAEVLLGLRERVLHHRDRRRIADGVLPEGERVARILAGIGHEHEERRRPCRRIRQMQEIAKLLRNGHRKGAFELAARDGLRIDEVVSLIEVARWLHRVHRACGRNRNRGDLDALGSRHALFHGAVAIRGVEAARDVQHDLARVGSMGLGHRVPHGVVPQVLAVVETLLGRARCAAHVPSRRAIDALPVRVARRQDRLGHERALVCTELADRVLATAHAELAPQQRRKVGSDDRDARCLRRLDERTVVALVVAPRPRTLQERGFVDLALAVGIERRLHIALEHLEREHDLVAAHAQQLLEHRQLDSMRGVVEVGLTQEHDVDLGEGRAERLPLDALATG